MNIIFDKLGVAMPDADVPEFARNAVVQNQDVHTSNELVLTWLRATLVLIPEDKRPPTTWSLCGVAVEADDHMHLDYWPEEACLSQRALEILIWPENPERAKLQYKTDEHPCGRDD